MTADALMIADLSQNDDFCKINLKIQKGHKINKEKLIDLLSLMDQPMQELALKILKSSAAIYKRSQMKPKRGIGSY